MINVNATIFVQIIHFLFVYFVLRCFLLRSVTTMIFSERAYNKKLENIIMSEKRMYIHKQEQQKKQWSMFQEKWEKQIPYLERYAKKIQIELDIKKVPLPQDMLHHEVQKITEYIKERVDRVK